MKKVVVKQMAPQHDKITFKCIEIQQPIGRFYVGAIDSKDLLNVAYADVRRIEKRDIEKYLGIERPLSPGRVSELQKYVNLIDATFPTSIILAIPSDEAVYNESKGTMSVTNGPDIAKIIDGQHRIAGLQEYKGPRFELNVTIFIDMYLEDQAMVFSTINLKQAKVSKSLSYDLYEFAKDRSPQKSCHIIARFLNTKEGSPLKDRIKILGTATGKPKETLTQATFIDRLIRYVSKDPMSDRDLIKRGRKLPVPSEKEARKLIFRNLFFAEKDTVIARILWNYFDAVSDRWSSAWNEVVKGNILNRTTGFAALMRFLRPVYLALQPDSKGPIQKASILDIFKGIHIADEDFSRERYLPGSTGEGNLFRDLLRESRLKQ